MAACSSPWASVSAVKPAMSANRNVAVDGSRSAARSGMTSSKHGPYGLGGGTRGPLARPADGRCAPRSKGRRRAHHRLARKRKVRANALDVHRAHRDFPSPTTAGSPARCLRRRVLSNCQRLRRASRTLARVDTAPQRGVRRQERPAGAERPRPLVHPGGGSGRPSERPAGPGCRPGSPPNKVDHGPPRPRASRRPGAEKTRVLQALPGVKPGGAHKPVDHGHHIGARSVATRRVPGSRPRRRRFAPGKWRHDQTHSTSPSPPARGGDHRRARPGGARADALRVAERSDGAARPPWSASPARACGDRAARGAAPTAAGGAFTSTATTARPPLAKRSRTGRLDGASVATADGAKVLTASAASLIVAQQLARRRRGRGH